MDKEPENKEIKDHIPVTDRPTTDPEDCETCKQEAEDSGMDYEIEVTWVLMIKDGFATNVVEPVKNIKITYVL